MSENEVFLFAGIPIPGSSRLWDWLVGPAIRLLSRGGVEPARVPLQAKCAAQQLPSTAVQPLDGFEAFLSLSASLHFLFLLPSAQSRGKWHFPLKLLSCSGIKLASPSSSIVFSGWPSACGRQRLSCTVAQPGALWLCCDSSHLAVGSAGGRRCPGAPLPSLCPSEGRWGGGWCLSGFSDPSPAVLIRKWGRHPPWLLTSPLLLSPSWPASATRSCLLWAQVSHRDSSTASPGSSKRILWWPRCTASWARSTRGPRRVSDEDLPVASAFPGPAASLLSHLSPAVACRPLLGQVACWRGPPCLWASDGGRGAALEPSCVPIRGQPMAQS